MPKRFNRGAIWWQAFRYHYVPPSFLPAMLGGVIAWSITGKFHLIYFFLTVLGVTLNHIALNLTDDYFDFRHAVDPVAASEKNPYSGGSGAITAGLLTPKQIFRAYWFGYSLTMAIGVALTIFRGWPVFALGVWGMACAYFYTAPPIRYGYYGFGEVSQLLNFSLTIGLGAYYVQAQQFSWEAAIVVLPLGCLMFSMITINEIPDRACDESGQKRTLVVIFGAKTAVWLYGLGLAAAFLTIALAPWLGYASFWIYLTFFGLPWAWQAFQILRQNYTDSQKMAPANALTIRVHNLTGNLLILAYLIQGIQNQSQLSPVVGYILAGLIIFNLPVWLTVFFNTLSIKTGANAKAIE
ncbi:prenyltransferase [candidate division KSB1 bacterium]|nr:prenyltransferase [candidate division KSB1 bacterium]